MRIKIHETRKQAARFAYPYLMRGRVVAIKKLNTGKWESRIRARKLR